MTSSTLELLIPTIRSVTVTRSTLTFEVEDGRSVAANEHRRMGALGRLRPRPDPIEVHELAAEARQVVTPPPAPIADEGEHYAGLPQSIEREYREYCENYA